MRDAATGIVPAAAAMGAAGNPTEVPRTTRPDLERFGQLAREIAETVEPKEGYGAVQALQELSLHIGLDKDGRTEAPSRVAVGPVVIAGTTSEEAEEQRKEIESAATAEEAKEKFKSSLDGYFMYLAFVALLTDTSARNAFASKIGPEDLPTELPRDLNGEVDGRLDGVQDVGEWRGLLFDEQGRIQISDPHHDPRRWTLFATWADHVNADLANAADALDGVIRAAYRSARPASP